MQCNDWAYIIIFANSSNIIEGHWTSCMFFKNDPRWLGLATGNLFAWFVGASRQSLSHLLSSILLTVRLVGELRVQEAQKIHQAQEDSEILHHATQLLILFYTQYARYDRNIIMKHQSISSISSLNLCITSQKLQNDRGLTSFANVLSENHKFWPHLIGTYNNLIDLVIVDYIKILCYMCHGQKSLYRGWSSHLLIGILIMGPYKPLRTWVDFSHPLLYANNRSWSTRSHIYAVISLRNHCLRTVELDLIFLCLLGRGMLRKHCWGGLWSTRHFFFWGGYHRDFWWWVWTCAWGLCSKWTMPLNSWGLFLEIYLIIVYKHPVMNLTMMAMSMVTRSERKRLLLREQIVNVAAWLMDGKVWRDSPRWQPVCTTNAFVLVRVLWGL